MDPLPSPVLVPITSIDDPRVQDYHAIRSRQVRPVAGQALADLDRSGEFSNGTFLAEGELVVKLLLKSRFRTRSVFLTHTRLETLGTDLEALSPDVPVYVADQTVMSGVVGFDIHRGVLAAGDRGDLRTLPALLASRPRGLVLLEDLANADNVGAIFRNAAALAPGFAIVLSPGCCDPLYRKSIRVSVGHALQVPFAIASNWVETLDLVRSTGYTLMALTPGSRSVAIDAFPVPERSAILVGTEGAGVSARAAEVAHSLVEIPMASGVDSLNVAVAAAIALHRFGGSVKTLPSQDLTSGSR